MATVAVGRGSRERLFYTGVAVAMFVTVFLGFARSFFLRPWFPDLPAPTEPVFFVHGAGRRPTGLVGIPVPPLQFLIVPFFDMVLFPTFVALAIAQRRDTQSHKRLMLLASVNLLAAGIARWPFAVMAAGPPMYFGLADLFAVVSQPLRLMLSGIDAWLACSRWAVGLLG